MGQNPALASAELGGEVVGTIGMAPQAEIDEAYRQLAAITGEPVDAVTPYGPELEAKGEAPATVVDPIAASIIRAKEARAARAPARMRSGRRVSSGVIAQARSERRDFHRRVNRAKTVARKMGQSVTAAARDCRESGAWRRGRAPAREHLSRRLPKEALATQS